MRESDRFQTVCGGGVAGALVKPNRPICATVQGDRGTNAIGSTWAIVSPETATHDIAHADSGSFVVGASFDALVQSIVADATGVAAISIVSQSGPSRTNSITVRRINVALRTSWRVGQHKPTCLPLRVALGRSQRLLQRGLAASMIVAVVPHYQLSPPGIVALTFPNPAK